MTIIYIQPLSGRLAVPIQYDTIITPLMHGFATGQRMGEPYVINSQGRELTQGKAERAACRDGRCSASVVRNKQMTLFDEEGRQLCPWYEIVPTGSNCTLLSQLPFAGHDGLTVIHNCRLDKGEGQANLVNRAGQVQLSWRYNGIRVWSNFYGMHFYTPSVVGGQWMLYNRRLQPMLSQPVDDLHELPGSWLTTGKELFQPNGRRITVPAPDKQWFVDTVPFLPDEPFAKGVWRVEWHDRAKQFGKLAGYLTIGGKQLWQD